MIVTKMQASSVMEETDTRQETAGNWMRRKVK